MILLEAAWIDDWISQYKPNAILNVGSSTHHFRTTEQPFQAVLFNGFNVCHVDAKEAEGVDIVYRVGEGRLREVTGVEYSCVLLTSVLEHVENRDDVMRDVESAMAHDGLLLVTVPCIWPYHPDPIDTLYRPDAKQLSEYVSQFAFRPIESVALPDSRGVCSAVAARRM